MAEQKQEIKMQTIDEILREQGFCPNAKQLEQLGEYSRLLLFYNEQFNLTAITDETEIIYKHYVDSLAGMELVRLGDRIMDIGSGAGFPSLPLKIFLPETEFVLLDSLNKRIGFLNEVVRQLELTGVIAFHSRIEEAAARVEHRERYDCVVARAVAPLRTLVEYALPFLKIGGRLIAYKGDKVEEELDEAKNALSKLRGKVTQIKKYTLMNTYSRHIIIVEKTAKTPAVYPRGQNKPKKAPL